MLIGLWICELENHPCSRIKTCGTGQTYAQDIHVRICGEGYFQIFNLPGCSYENTVLRRKLDWTFEEYSEQLHRLRHARQYANLYIDTNIMILEDVIRYVDQFIQSINTPNV
jgi:hypothetical protein